MHMKVPFSQQLSGGRRWINDDFPDTARIALIHLLHELVDRGYTSGWVPLDKEIRRIARDEPCTYDDSKAADLSAACVSVTQHVKEIKWTAALDFCERLHSYLARDVTEWNDFARSAEIVIAREKIQLFIAEELERIFLEERLGFSFSNNELRLRARRHSTQQIVKVEPTFADPRLTEARQHYAKALRYFESAENPDFENTVKEAVCAVEAAAKRLFPEAKGKTLGEVMKEIGNGKQKRVPKQLADTIVGLFAYRNGGEGIAHGATDGGKPSRAIAEYVLAVAASQIIFLHTLEGDSAVEVPF
jgi:hypothetical protein